MTEDIHVLFYEFQEGEDDPALSDGKFFDALAPGVYRDMFGREVEFKASELPTYARNTERVINSTKGESGRVLGLPIDARDHEKGDGAGWIVGVQVTKELLRLKPQWTEIGRDLISRGIRRLFSATVDTKAKVILGGTLTNWPALRDDNGELRLRPIELSSRLQAIDRPEQVVPGEDDRGEEKTMSEPKQQKEQDVPAGLTREEIAELVQTQVTEALSNVVRETAAEKGQPQTNGEGPQFDVLQFLEMEDAGEKIQTAFTEMMLGQYESWQEAAAQKTAQMIANMRREARVRELAAAVVNGTDNAPRGIPAPHDDLEGWLMTLNTKQLEFAEGLLRGITENGLVEFKELGHAKQQRALLTLEPFMAAQLTKWVDGELPVEEFFQENADSVEPMGRYDLSQWTEKQE